KNKINYFALFIFAVSMGFLEAIVVIYVRELYYPEGFAFPLNALPANLISIEIIREICTLLMLGSVAWLTAKTSLRRLSAFLFSFGVWDIIYYVALKLFLDWPESLLTWDILFLIPITWVGPVLAPIICSALMILMAVIFERFYLTKKLNEIKRAEFIFMVVGAVIISFAFTYDFGMLILKGGYLSDFFAIPENPEFLKELTTYIPTRFSWEIFSIGILFIFFGIGMIVKRVILNKN
ncbi:MAG: hypothetical protein HOG79_01680, partial [Prolixibacteraceae bacterium]|nr:hypothetical protein [Prolixibacteraceae bacterium]